MSFALIGAIIGVALYHFRSALLTKCAEIIVYVESKPAMPQVIVALATLILAFVVVWDGLTDKPKREIKKYRDEWDVDILSNGLKFERFYNPLVRKKIIEKLKEVGVKAVNPLIYRLEKDPNPYVRDAIVRTLGDI